MWALNPMKMVLVRDGRGEDRIGEGYGKTKTEIEVTQLPAEEFLLSSKTGRGKEDFPPRVFGGWVS